MSLKLKRPSSKDELLLVTSNNMIGWVSPGIFWNFMVKTSVSRELFSLRKTERKGKRGISWSNCLKSRDIMSMTKTVCNILLSSSKQMMVFRGGKNRMIRWSGQGSVTSRIDSLLLILFWVYFFTSLLSLLIFHNIKKCPSQNLKTFFRAQKSKTFTKRPSHLKAKLLSLKLKN